MESTMSEAKYLRKQSQRAKANVGKAIKGIKKDAASAVSPRRMIEKHPWTSIGIAVVVGFIVLAVVILSIMMDAPIFLLGMTF